MSEAFWWVDELRSRGFHHVDELVANPTAEIGAYVAHSQRRLLAVSLGQMVPGFDTAAVRSSTTGEQIQDWMDRARPDGGVRNPRGTYRGPACHLRILTDGDLGPLYASALNPETAHRWRFRGTTPAPEEFRSAVFSHDVLAQFVVARNSEPQHPIGLVVAYEADQWAGHCFLAFHRAELPPQQAEASRGLLTEGIFLLLEYVFDHFRFRKVYFELPAYNLGLLSQAGIAHEEGRLKDHFYARGRTWDSHIFAVYRTEFVPLVDAFRGGDAAG